VPPIHLFLDTSVLPRDLARIGHDLDKLGELVGAKLVKVHMPEIAVQEWRSQMIAEYMKVVKEMHSSIRSVVHHPLSAKLGHHTALAQLATDRESIIANAETIASEACDAFLKRLDVDIVKLDGEDAAKVFNRYFAGEPPFPQAKQRNDIPDAFIYQAASRLLFTLPFAGMHALVGDGRLGKALGNLPKVPVHESVKAFLLTDLAKEAMTHLELYKVWSGKEKTVLAFLAKKKEFAEEKITEYAINELTGSSFTDDSIPVDNNEAIIGYIDDIRDIEVDWDRTDQPGPGWVIVPFQFTCDADLDLQVFRSDAFSMPDWIHVSLGDFEEDHYFEGEANRELKISGWLSFSYTKEELEESELILPASVEVDSDMDIELVELPSDEEY